MQGHLSELDIRSILQLIELGQRTGELYVEAPVLPASLDGGREAAHEFSSWLVFFFNGQIVYAGGTSGQLTRLRDYLQSYEVASALDQTVVSQVAPFNSPEYGMLWALLEQRILSPEQGRMILGAMVEETLFELLSLHHGTFVFNVGPALNPQLMTFSIGQLVAKITQQVQEWHQLQPHIQSPQQCPIVTDISSLEPTPLLHKLRRLSEWTDGQTSIIQISRYLHRDILTVAKALYPYIKQGLIQLLPQGSTFRLNAVDADAIRRQEGVPRIVCVDDGLAVRQTVEQILDIHGYEVTSIANPLRALSLLFQLKPDLILCDIAMPELEGYQLCAMVRQSVRFREVPIIMLTGKDGFIDRVKARMSGATDYLTKPFGEQELLTLVEKYVGQGNPNRSQPEHLLAVEMADALDVDVSKATASASESAS